MKLTTYFDQLDSIFNKNLNKNLIKFQNLENQTPMTFVSRFSTEYINFGLNTVKVSDFVIAKLAGIKSKFGIFSRESRIKTIGFWHLGYDNQSINKKSDY